MPGPGTHRLSSWKATAGISVSSDTMHALFLFPDCRLDGWKRAEAGPDNIVGRTRPQRSSDMG